MMKIDPSRLRDVREQKRLTIRELNKASGVSPRHISRIENGTDPLQTVHKTTATRLAKGLGVELGVLTGELPMPPEPTQQAQPDRIGDWVRTSVYLNPEARLAFALVKRRYAVNPTTIINFAPLMFTLLAEGSLQWRETKAREVKEAAENLMNLGGGHLSIANAANRTLEALPEELKSIQSLDIFGRHVSQDAYELGYDPDETNPFVDYLAELVQRINKRDIVDVREPGIDDLPNYSVCEGEIARIACGIELADMALKWGHLRIGDIPEELLSENRDMERAAWLEEHIPDATRQLAELVNGVVTAELQKMTEENTND